MSNTQQQQRPRQNGGASIAVIQRATTERVRHFQQELELYKPNLLAVLPAHVSVEKFNRVLITAVTTNPDLLYADRRTLYTAAIRCASDGGLPDGREAALVVFNTEVKQRDPETGLDRRFSIDAVQYMPMIALVRKRMRNSGEVLSAEAEVVCRNDKFHYRLGDDPFIEHEPAPLGEPRGEIIGAYARIRLKSGEVLRDVMDREAIEKTRAQGRGSDKSLMWTKFYEEGCKKTVLRRCSKSAPQTAEFEGLLTHEPQPLQIGGPMADLPEAEPIREIEHDEGEGTTVDNIPAYTVTDNDGQVFELSSQAAVKGISAVFQDAANYDLQRLLAAWDNNQATIAEIAEDGGGAEAAALTSEFNELRDRMPAQAALTGRQTSETPPGPGSPPKAELPRQRPARAPAATSSAGDMFPGDLPPGERLVPRDPPADPPPDPERRYAIPVPNDRNGKPDLRSWAGGKFLPALRQFNSTGDLPYFMGDNAETLEAAKAVMTAADRKALEAEIAAKWEALKAQ